MIECVREVTEMSGSCEFPVYFFSVKTEFRLVMFVHQEKESLEKLREFFSSNEYQVLTLRVE